MIPSVMPTYARAALTFTHGSGAWLTDDQGRRYLDFGAGIAVNALGHAPAELTKALTEQAGKLWHVSNLYRVAEQEALADKLVDNTFADTVFFTNSGTECAELALKIARKHRPDGTILTFQGAFHGRSTGAISAAGPSKLTEGFGPLMPGFRMLPFGDMEALRAAADGSTAAILIEPIQGEGGIRPVPAADLHTLREIADETGALLIFDEVQCGVGRTGKLFAHEWAGVAPDVMMVAKGIGGGFPLGAVLATAAAAAPMGPGTHGSTYGGNPLACAVGLKLLDIVADPVFLDSVTRKANQLRQGLEALKDAHPDLIAEIRGQGLMLGLKLTQPPAALVAAARDAGLLTVPAADDTLRLLPPLNIADTDIHTALAKLDQAAATLGSK